MKKPPAGEASETSLGFSSHLSLVIKFEERRSHDFPSNRRAATSSTEANLSRIVSPLDVVINFWTSFSAEIFD
jgi:hypothetical protein